VNRGRVLIGFAESLAAIESAWCLADAGYEVVAFTRSGRRPALASSRRVRVVPVPAPESSASACVAALRDLVAAEAPVAVLPLDDHAVRLCDRLPAPVVVAGPRGPQARLALDKREQVDLAAKADLLVPPTAIAGTEPPPGDGPWMVKPALATVDSDDKLSRPAGAIARSPADVDRIATELGVPALVQPLLDGTGEGLFGFALDGRITGLSAHRRVRMMNPRGSGSSACRSIPVDPALVEPARRFLADAGWHGIFMLELLRDAEGRPWFMELNGRAWGSMALALRRGLPYPVWAVSAAVSPDFCPAVPPDGPHVTARHLGRELVHLLAVLRGARGGDVGRWPSRTATLGAMLRPSRGTRWYHSHEFRVLVRDTWDTVGSQVRRRS
jgi:hypothetical protein